MAFFFSAAASALAAVRQGHWQAALALLDGAEQPTPVDILTACALNPGLAPFMLAVI